MNVAFTVWGNRISPVFDSAQTLLVVKIREDQVVDKQIHLFQTILFAKCLKMLDELDVQVLICGALCEGPAKILESRNIEVIPFITGEVEEILQWYVQGKDLNTFAMPGCRHGRCCRTRDGGRRRGKVNGRIKNEV